MRLKWHKGNLWYRFSLTDETRILETTVDTIDPRTEKWFTAVAFWGLFRIKVATNTLFKDGTRAWQVYLFVPSAEGKTGETPIRLFHLRGTLREAIDAAEKKLFSENFTADIAYVPGEDATADSEVPFTAPARCPVCGAEVKVYGPMDHRPQWPDEDAGCDPVCIVCDCGLNFSCGSYDYQETFKAFNRRAKA